MQHEIQLPRREGDSNPRSQVLGTTVFETAAFDHSAISPNRVWVSEFRIFTRTLHLHTHTHTCFAEKEGFEPPVPSSRDNGFQDRRIRPLCHFSFEAANLQTFIKLTSPDLKICQILTYPDLKLIKMPF